MVSRLKSRLKSRLTNRLVSKLETDEPTYVAVSLNSFWIAVPDGKHLLKEQL